MLQLEDHALAGRQPVQRARDPCAQFPAHKITLRIGGSPPIRHTLQHIVLLAFRICRDRRIFFSHLLLPQVIEAEIGDDAVNPGIKRTLEAKTADVLVRLQERFLINVLGFRVRAGKMHSQPEHCLVVVPYNSSKAARLPRCASRMSKLSSIRPRPCPAIWPRHEGFWDLLLRSAW